MMLRDLQVRFLDALISGSTDAVCADIVGGNLSSAQRLAFYQNNLIGNQRAALQSIYPVVARLVGDVQAADVLAGDAGIRADVDDIDAA